MGITFSYYIPTEWFIGYRYGLGANTDLGVRIFDPFIDPANTLWWIGAQMDLKHQFKDRIPYISFDFASSLGYGYVPEEYVIGRQECLTYAFSPSLIVGNENWYVAGRIIKGYSQCGYGNNFPWEKSSHFWYGISLGYRFLIKKRIILGLELSMMKDIPETMELFLFPAFVWGIRF